MDTTNPSPDPVAQAPLREVEPSRPPRVTRISRTAGYAVVGLLALVLLASAYFSVPPKQQKEGAAKPLASETEERRRQLDDYLATQKAQGQQAALPPPPAYTPPSPAPAYPAEADQLAPRGFEHGRDVAQLPYASSSPNPSAAAAADPLTRSLRSSLAPAGLSDSAPLPGGGGPLLSPPAPSAPPDLTSPDFAQLARSLTQQTAPGEAASRDREPRSSQPFAAVNSGLPVTAILRKGSTIPAVLETAINSDNKGQVSALVRRDIYDSATASRILIPHASRLVGVLASTPRYGQGRLEILWTDLILPGGRRYSLPDLPGADHAGAAGLPGEVNNHLGRLYGSSVLLSLISAGTQLSQPTNSAGTLGIRPTTPGEVAAGALGQELGNTSSALIDRELKVPPSISLLPGTVFSVSVTSDILFPSLMPRLHP